MPAGDLLPALGHAVSGATGTAISTAATYPLDLANTRLKVQRQLRRDKAIPDSEGEYRGVADVLARAREREGGLRALYAGLGPDAAKGVADSFLFFLFYAWLRSRQASRGAGRRAGRRRRRLQAWEELAVGAAAGACARLFTTPIGNVVTRRQTASLVAGGGGGGVDDDDGNDPRDLSVAGTLHTIWAERGLLGLWAGYSATLVLTLNPSLTFYLQTALKKALVDRGQEGGSGWVTFLVAAVSKVVATAATYPFQIAKARSQISAPESTKPEPGGEAEASGGEKGKLIAGHAGEDVGAPESKTNVLSRRLHGLVEETIFATVYRIGRTEGVPALYDGLSGELLKAFLNHGTTMLSKDIVHKLIVRLYFFILAFIRRSPAAQALLRRRSSEEMRKFGGLQVAEKLARIKDGSFILNILERTQRLVVTR